MREKAVCLVSGGMDSCVAAAVAGAAGLQLAFLHVKYGQLTQSREERSFNDLADHYAVGHRLITDIRYFSQIGGSALTDRSVSLPEGAVDRAHIPVSYVPFRNANFLSIATSWAEVLGAAAIYMGAVEEDSSGYPDCRESFFRVFGEVIREGTRPETDIRIVTPLIKLRKSEIVQRGIELGAPLHLTWSCYQSLDVPCGCCDSCLLRERAFTEAGQKDPLLLESSD